MNKDPERIKLHIIASSDFNEALHKEKNIDVVTVSAADNMDMQLGLGEIVSIVALIKSLIDIVEFAIKYFKKKEKSERIVLILNDGEQIVISSIEKAEQILVKFKRQKDKP
jgi:hypothetical protein